MGQDRITLLLGLRAIPLDSDQDCWKNVRQWTRRSGRCRGSLAADRAVARTSSSFRLFAGAVSAATLTLTSIRSPAATSTGEDSIFVRMRAPISSPVFESVEARNATNSSSTYPESSITGTQAATRFFRDELEHFVTDCPTVRQVDSVQPGDVDQQDECLFVFFSG